MGHFFHGVVINFFGRIQTVTHHIEPFAAHVQVHAMGQVTAFCQAHAHDGVAGLQQSQEHRLVGLRAGVGLNVGEIGAIQFFEPVNTQLLNNVDKFTTAVITLARVTLGVFVGQDRALESHDRRTGVVFRGDQLNVLFLPMRFLQHGRPQLRVTV